MAVRLMPSGTERAKALLRAEMLSTEAISSFS